MRFAIPSTVAAAIAAAPFASAQTVCFRHIVGGGDGINPNGAKPALHDGTVAFLGYSTATGIGGIYMAAADGSGEIFTVADQATEAPNQPDTFFTTFWNPDIYSGLVVFAARYDASGIDGIYIGSDEELYTFVDSGDGPPDNQDAIGPEGVAWESGDPITGYYSTPWFKHATGGSAFPIAVWGDGMPGGGTLVDIDAQPPTLDGGVVTLAAYVSHSTDVDGGVYLWYPESDTFNLISNWNVQMPGRSEFFEYFGAAHSDGQNVVLTGRHGYLGFGGHQGVYVAPADSPTSEPSSLTKIAEIGDPAPGGGEFGSFGDVAIDGEVIVFEGFFGHPAAPDHMALFAKIGDGPIFRVVEPGDQIADFTLQSVNFNFRGISGNQIVFRSSLGPPPGGGYIDHALFVATLHPDDGVECPDPTGDPDPPTLPDCREWLVGTAPPLEGSGFRDMEVLAQDEVWAVGFMGGLESLSARWDGQDWTIIPTPPIDGRNITLEGVSVSAPDNVWAVGNYVPSTDVVQSAALHFDGEQWTVIDLTNPHPTASWIRDVYAAAPDDVWAVGFTGVPMEDGTHFWLTHYDGSTWTDVPLPDFTAAQVDELQGIDGTGPNDIWAGGSAGIPGEYQNVIFHYDGETWNLVDVPQPLANPTIYDIAAVTPDLAWAVGDKFMSGYGHMTMTLRWNGVEWEQLLSPNPGAGWNMLFAVAGSETGDAYAAGYHYYGAVSEPIALSWSHADDAWVGHDLEMVGYSTSAWAAGALPNGDGIVAGTIGYYGAPPDPLVRYFTRPGGPADLDCDEVVSFADLLALLALWGPCDEPWACPADIDGDGAVGFGDLIIVLAAWGG